MRQRWGPRPTLVWVVLGAVGTVAGTGQQAVAEDIGMAPAAAQRPLLGWVNVGSATGDDRGPAREVMADAFCTSGAEIVTVVGSNWSQAQPDDPGDAQDTFDWTWFDEAVAPFRACGKTLVSYCAVGAPKWLQVPYGSPEFWRRQEAFFEAYFRRCSEAGIFLHIFENEPDGLQGSRADWIEWYLDRLAHCRAAARRVDLRHRLIGGNLFSVRPYHDFYARGFKDLCDIVGFHNYSNNPHSGNDLEAVIQLRQVMVEHGDGDKQIFLGEGWGPGRELATVRRNAPHEALSPLEIADLRGYVINGYRNLTTPTDRYDPAWVFAALFFTFNDNYGGYGWKARAVPLRDATGRLLTYVVDGYHVGLQIEPRFYNGGLATYYGTGKDTLLALFPGHHLALANPGFEYETRDRTPEAWTIEGGGIVDRSIRRSGHCSLRLESLDGRPCWAEQCLPDTALASARAGVVLSAWVRTLDATDAQAVQLSVVCDEVPVATTAPMGQSMAWERVELAVPPCPATRSILVRLALQGHGTVWMDDCFLVDAPRAGPASLLAHVYDRAHRPIRGASVEILAARPWMVAARDSAVSFPSSCGESDNDNHLRYENLEPGVYDLRCTAPGYEPQVFSAVVLSPGRCSTTGFELLAVDPHLPQAVTATDLRTGHEVLLEWNPPADPRAAQTTVYRATAPLEFGRPIATVVDAQQFVDKDLTTGTTYWYTLVPADSSGTLLVEPEQAHARAIAVTPTFGEPFVPYSVQEDADWDKATEFAQTFVATDSGWLLSANCIPAATNPILTFRVLQGGPTGETVGPERIVPGTSDQWATATWAVGDVPVVAGATYCVVVRATGAWSIYHTRTDHYAAGDLWIDGLPSRERTTSGQSVDMWCTVRCARPPLAYIHDVQVVETGRDWALIRWKTRLPSTAQIAYGQKFRLQQTLNLGVVAQREFEIRLRGLTPRMRYAFKIRARWAKGTVELSPYYAFDTLP